MQDREPLATSRATGDHTPFDRGRDIGAQGHPASKYFFKTATGGRQISLRCERTIAAARSFSSGKIAFPPHFNELLSLFDNDQERIAAGLPRATRTTRTRGRTMAVLNPDASASLAYFILATLGLRFAVYRFVQLRAKDMNASALLRVAHDEVAAETPDAGQTILETTPSQIYDVVVYRRRRRRSRDAAQPASRLAG